MSKVIGRIPQKEESEIGVEEGGYRRSDDSPLQEGRLHEKTYSKATQIYDRAKEIDERTRALEKHLNRLFGPLSNQSPREADSVRSYQSDFHEPPLQVALEFGSTLALTVLCFWNALIAAHLPLLAHSSIWLALGFPALGLAVSLALKLR